MCNCSEEKANALLEELIFNVKDWPKFKVLNTRRERSKMLFVFSSKSTKLKEICVFFYNLCLTKVINQPHLNSPTYYTLGNTQSFRVVLSGWVIYQRWKVTPTLTLGIKFLFPISYKRKKWTAKFWDEFVKTSDFSTLKIDPHHAPKTLRSYWPHHVPKALHSYSPHLSNVRNWQPFS